MTRSHVAGKQEVASSQAEVSKTKCKVCGGEFQLFYSHLKRAEDCRVHYDMTTVELEEKRRKREQKKAYHKNHKESIKASKKEHYKDHKESIKAYKKEHYKQHVTEKKESMNTYYQKNKESILKNMAKERKRKFADKAEFDRFKDFKDSMIDVCAYGCICCHKILSTTKDNKVAGGLKGLEKELKSLFKECILKEEELPKELRNAKEVYLCNTCRKWLKQHAQMPPRCYKNGLQVDPMPPELENLNDLEETLIAQRIIFIKMFNLPVSRWPGTKDHCIMVPIDQDTLLNSLDMVAQFPRLPNEAGLIPVDLKRMKKLKNTHKHDYIHPKNLVSALQKLIDINQFYKDIQIENRYSKQTDDLSDKDDSEGDNEPSSDEGEDSLDSVRRNQLDTGGATTLTNTDPTANVLTNLPQRDSDKIGDNGQPRLAVAPGEGKRPTNLMRDEFWDAKAFPTLYPTGKFGLHHPRHFFKSRKNLTYQEFFEQRLCNVDPRWRKHKPFVFAALYCIERHSLEKAMGIS